MKTVIVGGVAAGASTGARLRRLEESAELIILEGDHYVSFRPRERTNPVMPKTTPMREMSSDELAPARSAVRS